MAKMFDRIMKGLEEVQAIARNEATPGRLSRKRLRIPAPANLSAAEIRAIRIKDGCSQESFAQLLAVSVETVRKWEQGKNEPTNSNLRLLDILSRHPEIVDEIAMIN